MPNEYCDKEPCRHLRAAIIRLVPVNRPLDVLSFHVRDRAVDMDILTPVILYYCPFCGVRLHENDGILFWANKVREAILKAAPEEQVERLRPTVSVPSARK